MDLKSIKSELRLTVQHEITGLSDEYISESDAGLFYHIKSLKEFIAARNIMLYCSVKREPATPEIAKIAFAAGKTVAYPLCYRNGIMQARIVADLSRLKPAMLGIPAPSETDPAIDPEDLDLIIVPALTYDKSGFRLGYGGGYYDRYLAGISAFTVGIARDRLIRDELPGEPHDIAVKCVITESGILCRM